MGHSLIASIKTFGLSLQEGAEAARCDGCSEDLYERTTSSIPDYIYLVLSSVFFVVAIIMAMLFVKNAIKSINRKEEFNGMEWGLANGIFGLGFIFAIVAIVSVYNEIKQIKDKKYAKYAKEQLKQFVITYVLCCAAWLVAGFAIGFLSA